MATILKRGDYQWQATIRKSGFNTQSKTFETKRDAADWAKTVESEMRRGLFQDRSEAEKMTFGQALTRYACEVTPEKKSAARELNRIKAMQKEAFCQYSLAALRPRDFSLYRDRRLKEVGPNTVRLELALISHVFTIAKKEWDLAVDNPVSGIRKPKLPVGRDRRLQEGEEEQLMKVIKCRDLKLAVKLAIATGMREGEIVGLTWGQVDFRQQIIKLTKTKNGTERAIWC